MNILSNRAMFCIAAVLTIAIDPGVSAGEITDSLVLPKRNLEPYLQALGRSGVVTGKRGPHGGYILGRNPREITLGEIVRIAQRGILSHPSGTLLESRLFREVVVKNVARAGHSFLDNLDKITIADLLTRAETLTLDGHSQESLPPPLRDGSISATG